MSDRSAVRDAGAVPFKQQRDPLCDSGSENVEAMTSSFQKLFSSPNSELSEHLPVLSHLKGQFPIGVALCDMSLQTASSFTPVADTPRHGSEARDQGSILSECNAEAHEGPRSCPQISSKTCSG